MFSKDFSGIKKPTYIFLSAMLGMLIFLILHRVVVFFVMAGVYFNSGDGFMGANYLQFLAWDYLTLILVLMLGAWYGIWVGSYWYEKVYESKLHGGFLSHVLGFRQQGPAREILGEKMEELSENIQEEIWELDQLSKNITKAARTPKPIKRKVVKRRAPKKTL